MKNRTARQMKFYNLINIETNRVLKAVHLYEDEAVVFNRAFGLNGVMKRYIVAD